MVLVKHDLNNIIQPSEYIVGTQTASTSAWTGNLEKVTKLKEGQIIYYKLPYASTSTAVTLNLTFADGTTTGAKEVWFWNGSRMTTQYGVYSVVGLVYNGSQWWAINPSNNNNNDYLRPCTRIVNGDTAQIPANRIIGAVSDTNGVGKYYIVVGGKVLDMRYPILYNTSAINSGGYTDNVYLSHTGVPLANNVTGKTVTSQRQVYIEGTAYSNNKLTVSSKVFVSDDDLVNNNYYVYIGVSYSANYIRFSGFNQMVYKKTSNGLIPVSDWNTMENKPSSFTPSTHTHGNITNDGKIGSTANLPVITGTNGVVTTGSFGTGANTFCQGNDSRLSNARTPVFNHIGATSTATKDLNSYTTGGFYYCNNDNSEAPYISNQPWTSGQKAFFLLVETWGASNNSYVKQTLTYYTTGQTYVRTKASSSWTSWIEMTKDTTYTPASATPLRMHGNTGVVGTSTKYAREDHKHPRYTNYSESNTTADGYYKLFRVTVGSWCNKPFVFKIIRRGATQELEYKLRFTNVNVDTTLPTVSSLYNTGESFDLWVYDNKDKTFDIIVKEPETYFQCDVEFYDAMNLAITDLKTRLTATEFNALTTAQLTKSTFIGFTSAEKTKLAGISTGANAYTHPNSGVTAGTNYNGNQTPSFGGTFNIPKLTFNAQGHITASANSTVTVPSLPTASTSTAGIIQIGSGSTNASAGNHGHGKVTSGGTLSETTTSVNNVVVTDTTNNNLRVINKVPFANLNITKSDITGLGIPSSDTNTTYTADESSLTKSSANAFSIKSGGVTSSHIADKTIVNGDIADGTIESGKIKDSAITSAKIADGTIVNGDIANTTIQGGKLVNGTITATQLASNSVETAKIKDGAVTNSKLSATIIPNGTSSAKNSLNNYTSLGFYYQSSNSNTTYIEQLPESGKAFWLLVEDWGTANYTKQTLTHYNSNKTYTRIRNAGTWGAWTELTKDTNTTYSAGTGLTLSGTSFSLTDASNYVKKSSTSGYIKNDGTIGTPTNTTYSAGTGLTLSGTSFSVKYGTAAGTACQGNDSRLSNARTPTAHEQASSTITQTWDSNKLGNIAPTLVGTNITSMTQEAINDAINYRLGELFTWTDLSSSLTQNSAYTVTFKVNEGLRLAELFYSRTTWSVTKNSDSTSAINIPSQYCPSTVVTNFIGTGLIMYVGTTGNLVAVNNTSATASFNGNHHWLWHY